MKSILELLYKFFTFVIGLIAGIFIGIGGIGALTILTVLASIIGGSLIIALPIDWIYGLLQVDLVQIALPTIGYWAWFKILVLLKLVSSFLITKAVPQDKKKDKKKDTVNQKPPVRTTIPN